MRYAILGGLLLATLSLPAWGLFRRIERGDDLEATARLPGGKRTCVLFCGDHQPVQDLQIRIFDSKSKLVAEVGGEEEGDMQCIVFYPERTDEYRFQFVNGKRMHNFCTIVVK